MSDNQLLDQETQQLILETELRATVQRSMRPVARGLAILYSIFAISHSLVLSRQIRFPMALTAAATAAILAAIAWYLKSHQLPIRFIHPVSAGIAGLVLFNSGLHLWLTGDILQSTNFILLLLGSAFFLLSSRWFWIVSGMTTLSWSLAIVGLAPATTRLHFVFALISALVLAALVHAERRKTLERLERVRLQEEHRQAELQVALQASFRDITARKEMAHLLRQERDFTTAVLDTADALILVLDHQARIVRFNQACERTTGYTAPEVEGQPFWDIFLLADERAQIEKLFGDMRAGHFPIEHTNHWVTKSGDIRIVEWSNTALLDPGGRVSHVVAAGIDVTERDRARHALAERTSYLEGVLAAAPDAIVTLDEQHRILEWNGGAESLFGYRRDEVVGKYIDPLITNPECQDEAISLTRQATAGQMIGPLETIRYRKDGDPVDVIVAGSPIRIEGELVGAAAVYTDITALKQAEASLRERNADLDAFSHTVAHDLKGPLNNIYGYISLLESDGPETDPDMLAEGIDVIAASARRMINIIDALLLLAGLTGAEAEFDVVDTAAIVAEALERLSYRIKSTGAVVTHPDTWPKAVGYGPWIEEVWVNYISNALKYGGNPPRIELGAEKQDRRVKFWVRDNGPGLTSADQDQLFTPFTRLSQVRVEGHGLGLSIVRRIVERLDGSVGVHSIPGEGSTFYFYLPRT